MKIKFTVNCSLDHIDPSYIDVDVDCFAEFYLGSNYPDDPSSLEIITSRIDGNLVFLDEKSEKIITDRFWDDHPEYCKTPDDNLIERWRNE